MKISIIIPTWRDDQNLNNCLQSLFVQKYPQNEFEIILVSKRKLDIKHPLVKIIKIGNRVNHAEARNIGVQKSKGEILAFCDDDCYLPKNWLKIGTTYFTKKDSADLIGGPAIPPYNDSFRFRLSGYLAGSRFTIGFAASRHRPLFPEQVAQEFDLILANTFIRKSVFKKFGGFNIHQVPCEENFLYAKVKNDGYKLLYVPRLACSHPAKPLFFPWAQKIFFYAAGRGMLIIRAPETFHLQYLVPSLFTITLTGLTVLSIYSLSARLLLTILLFIYFVSSLINSAYIFFLFEKNPLIFLLAPLATILIHISYGLGFLYGLGRYIIGWRQAIEMPNKK